MGTRKKQTVAVMEPKKAVIEKRKAGRPAIPEQDKETDKVVVACLTVGGTFREAAELIKVEHTSIFSRMVKEPVFNEQVMHARAKGVLFRKMQFEDSLHTAVNKIVDTPAYTVLAIFMAKAQLKLTDMPIQEAQTLGLAAVLQEIWKRKQGASQLQGLTDRNQQGNRLADYLPRETTVKHGNDNGQVESGARDGTKVVG